MGVNGIGLYANDCFVHYAITVCRSRFMETVLTLCYARPVFILQVCKTEKNLWSPASRHELRILPLNSNCTSGSRTHGLQILFSHLGNLHMAPAAPAANALNTHAHVTQYLSASPSTHGP
jgi:hypothetical protein